MTLRLLARGHAVTVWNRSPAKSAAAVEHGATLAATPAAVVEAADVILMCLLDTAAVEAVAFGRDGIAAAVGAGKLLVDHASIRPDATRSFAARLAAANGMQWVDAPVSGGVAGAEAGTLTVMLGGEEAACARAQPVLEAYARNITRMGPVGTGQTTKLCNQIIVATTVAIAGEAVRLAQAAGVDAGLLPQALAGGFADSKPFQTWVPRMVHGWTEPLATANLLLKDLDTALALARATGTPLPVAEQVRSLFAALDRRGEGTSDVAAIIRLYQGA
jgi:3-hydroxyisobutyrate dehydrogenase